MKTPTSRKGDLAIRITGLSKEYRLGKVGSGTLQRDLQSWWARARGREDPNSVIGAPTRIVGDRMLALDGIDLEVRRGEALGIIGRNGAGKSTLLKILSRITGPSAGTAELFGRVTSMLEVGTGFHGEMTGRENIYLNGAILGMTRAEIDAAMDDIIAFSEIGPLIDTPVKRYSSGMYVKLAFSVAAHLRGEIMIMDEVLAVGDMAFQRKCLDAMREAARNDDRTVLYVSHNMATIRRLCTRCIVLDEGRVVFDGDPEEAIRLYLAGTDDSARPTTSIDYAGMDPYPWLAGHHLVWLRGAEYVGRDDVTFGDGEAMHLRLTWGMLQDARNVSLRLEVYTTDDVPQGTFYLLDLFSGNAGEAMEAVIDVDLSMLIESSYYMKYTFFLRDDVGGHLNVECRRGLPFDRVSDGPDSLAWEPRNWGYVKLPGATVASLGRIGSEGA